MRGEREERRGERGEERERKGERRGGKWGGVGGGGWIVSSYNKGVTYSENKQPNCAATLGSVLIC